MTNVIQLGLTDRGDREENPDGELATVIGFGDRAVYNVTQVAKMLSLSRGSAYNLVRNGTIPALKLGNRWVIPRKRFHAWLDGLVEHADNGTES